MSAELQHRMVFQSYALYLQITVRENMLLGLQLSEECDQVLFDDESELVIAV